MFAGGLFTAIGGQSRSYLAGLDTTTGLATSWTPGTSGTCYTWVQYTSVAGPCSVNALLVDADTLYASGSFTAASGGFRPYLAGWALNTPPTASPTATPPGVLLTPAATNVVVTAVPGVGITLPVVPTAANGGEVRFAVTTPAPGAVPTRLAVSARPIKAIVVELSVNGVANHDNLPQPAVVTVDFAASELDPGSDPLKLVLYLSSDGVTWEALTDTVVTSLGNGQYRATASAPHFSYLALGDSHIRIFVPAAPRSQAGW